MLKYLYFSQTHRTINGLVEYELELILGLHWSFLWFFYFEQSRFRFSMGSHYPNVKVPIGTNTPN